MKPCISCNIEVLSVPGEAALVISIPAEAVPDAVVLLTAMLYGKYNRINFADKSCTAALSASDGYALNLEDKQIAVTKVWVEAFLGMLLDVCLHGWSDTAHLDQDFENLSVAVAVLPPY